MGECRNKMKQSQGTQGHGMLLAQWWRKLCLLTHPWVKQYKFKDLSAMYCQSAGKHSKGEERRKTVNNWFILPQQTLLVLKNNLLSLNAIKPTPSKSIRMPHPIILSGLKFGTSWSASDQNKAGDIWAPGYTFITSHLSILQDRNKNRHKAKNKFVFCGHVK